jgi:hypothetical protein
LQKTLSLACNEKNRKKKKERKEKKKQPNFAYAFALFRLPEAGS